MSTDNFKKLSSKYCPRFGQLAVEMGFITVSQLMEASRCQIEDVHSGQGHRLIGQILLDAEWMTSDQVEQVMNMLLKRMRLDDQNQSFNIDSDLNSMTPKGECNG